MKIQKQDIQGVLTMELTTDMEKLVKETFNIEIEMMQGTKEKLPNGMTKYTLTVAGQKAEMVKEFILRPISNSHKACKQ